MVSGQLEDSLRHEIESYIEGRLSGVRQEIAQLQSELNESLSRLLDRQGEVQLDGSVAASILEHLRAAHEEGIEIAAAESSRAKASSDMAIVKAAITEVDEQRSQADILTTLVNRSASFAPRVAFFVIKGDQVSGWRARGFQGSVGDDAIRQLSLSTSADTVVGEVSNSRTTWSGGPHSHSEDHLILNRLGEEPPQRVVAIPLVVRARTVAVLYADSAGLDSEAINLEALETLVRASAMAVELLAARTAPAKRAAAEPVAAPPVATEAPEPMPAEESIPAYVPTREYEEPPTRVTDEPAPELRPIEAEPAAVESDYDTATSPIATSVPVPEPGSIYEAQPSAPAAEASTPASGRRRYGMDVDLPVEVGSEEERRSHNDARRFARLLVSEIKLYNEQKVIEGRSQHDLYERLREYIDRSREMYDKRVKPEVARKYDYFHHELVTTLAEGDTEKLGNAYPGATVSA
ncbi:MAG: hypothetical protein ACRD6N_02320 [Pyrinomonadaceae bacterium]